MDLKLQQYLNKNIVNDLLLKFVICKTDFFSFQHFKISEYPDVIFCVTDTIISGYKNNGIYEYMYIYTKVEKVEFTNKYFIVKNERISFKKKKKKFSFDISGDVYFTKYDCSKPEYISIDIITSSKSLMIIKKKIPTYMISLKNPRGMLLYNITRKTLDITISENLKTFFFKLKELARSHKNNIPKKFRDIPLYRPKVKKLLNLKLVTADLHFYKVFVTKRGLFYLYYCKMK